MHTLIWILDLAGTFVFGVSGAAAAVERKLDIFGVLVLSFIVGVAGGTMRDVVIGAIPPAALAGWYYFAVAILAALFTFFCHPVVRRLQSFLLLLDAAGLAIFVASGTQKALVHGMNPFAAMLLGVLTGIGGGVMRDVLLTEIPTVLRREVYASAAIAGAGAMVAGNALHLPASATASISMLICFGLRLLAIRYHWHLPVSRASGSDAHVA